MRHHFGEGWSADAQLPVGSVRYDPGPGFEQGRLSGLGDLELGARYELAALWGAGGYRPSLTVRLGGRLPSGKQERVVVSGFPPSVLGVGRGVFALTGQLALTQFVHPVLALQASLSGMQPLGRTEIGIQFGTSAGLDVGALLLPVDDLAIVAQLSGLIREPADEAIRGELVSSGGTWLAAELGASYRVSDRLSVGARGRVPVFMDLNGTQVAETFSASLTVALAFGGADEDDAHDHADGDAHDHADGDDHDHEDGDAGRLRDPAPAGRAPAGEHGPSSRPTRGAAADVVDLATGGQSFELAAALAPGKLTVIDFWAEWCAPCQVIDRRLRALADRHPGLAVRRVEVPDFDSPVAQAQLPNVKGLPVVWIFDASGARVAELVGVAPEAVVREVRTRLERSP